MLTEELMREVHRLEIRARRRVNNLFAGEYSAAFRGQGIEFAEVREYTPGDDVRAIDWNVTARTGRPFIKRFQEERQLTVVLAVDRSASMRFGTGRSDKARLAAEVAAVLAYAASRNSDRSALLCFGAGAPAWIAPSKGRGHMTRLVREVLADPDPSARHDGFTTLEAVGRLNTTLNRHSIVLLLTDLLDVDPAEDRLVRDTSRLASKHDVVLLHVQDPAEADPPRGLVTLVDPEAGRAFRADLSRPRTRRRYRETMNARSLAVERFCRRTGTDLVRLSPAEPFGDVLAAYFRQRERTRAVR